MRRSDSFRFTIRSDEHENVIYLGERRFPRFLELILRGGRPPREIPVREQDSPAFYRTLFNLLQNRGLPVSSLEAMPTGLNLDLKDLRRLDPRKRLLLGMDQHGQRLELDLDSAAHGFITGGEGASRTVVLENLLSQGLLSENVEIWLADALRVSFGDYPLRAQDRCAGRPEELAELLQDLILEARDRHRRLSEENVNSYVDLSGSPRAIFLAISGIVHFIGDPGLRAQESDRILAGELRSLLRELLELSESVGIHLFLETSRTARLEDFEELLGYFGTRILLGKSNTEEQIFFLGSASAATGRTLQVRGRGLLADGGEPILFQGYRLPRQTIKDQLGTANRAFHYGEE